jgi:heat shock protein HslJ
MSHSRLLTVEARRMTSTEQDKTMPDVDRRRPRRTWVIAAAALAVPGVVATIGVAASDNHEPPPAGVDPVATDPSDLIGTWRPTFIKGFTKLDSTRPDAATVTFGDDGAWHGSDGCNGVGGTYDADAGDISVKSGEQTAIGCDNVPNIDVLGESAHFRVSGKVLILYDANWDRLASYSRTS